MADILTNFKAMLAAGLHARPAPIETLPNRLAAAAAAVLPADGVGISLLDDQSFRVPLGASSPHAENAERLQFTLGEGPCLQAAAEQTMTRYTELGLARHWPVFHGELIQKTPYRAIASIPLHHATALRGAIDVYFTDPRAARLPDQQTTATVANAVGHALVGHPDFGAAGPNLSWLDAPTVAARTNLWVAIGMLNVHLIIGNSDALAQLRGYAWSHNATVDDIAGRLIAGLLPLQAFDD